MDMLSKNKEGNIETTPEHQVEPDNRALDEVPVAESSESEMMVDEGRSQSQ